MKKQNKPLVFISSCIELKACRYDGTKIHSEFVKRLKDYLDIITVCPEMSIGLSIPREAIRVIKNDQERLVYSLTGKDVTKDMTDFSSQYVDTLKDKNIHGFILKNRSPSCGMKDVKVYKNFGKSMALPDKTTGYFSREILKKYPSAAIEDEGRLMNYHIREHFLTRVFTMHAYDQVIEAEDMKTLIDFHSQHKYLLMAYSQSMQKTLGKIVANHDNLPVLEVILNYKESLQLALSHPLRRGTNINMLMHLFGYFKKDLKKEEKSYFLNLLDLYKNRKIPFTVPLTLLYGWVIRFDQSYLMDQKIFNPYPVEILDVSDSGKGID